MILSISLGWAVSKIRSGDEKADEEHDSASI
jgi:hypothetical protein